MAEIKCKKCGYKWQSKSKHIYVSCPSCLGKVRNVFEKIKRGMKNGI